MNRFRDIEFPFSALLLLSVLWTQKPNIPFDQTRRIQSQSFALIGSYTSGTQIYRCKHYLQIGMLLIASICHVMIGQRISCIQTFDVFIEVSFNGYFMNCKSGDNYSSRLVAELFSTHFAFALEVVKLLCPQILVYRRSTAIVAIYVLF